MGSPVDVDSKGSKGESKARLLIMALKEEIRRFCVSSSIKGVPRVISSEGYSLKAFWILAVLALFCFASFQAYQLLASYLEFAVVTSFYEKIFHPSSFVPSLPVSTICNENPIVHDAPAGTPSYAEFLLMVDEHLACSDCTAEEKKRRREVGKMMKTPHGYFQFVGRTVAQQMSTGIDEFIIRCEVIAFAGPEQMVQVPCDGLVHKKQYFLKSRFNCFDLVAVKSSLPSGIMILGVQLVLHLGSYQQHTGSLLNGAFLFLSENGINDASLMSLEGNHIPAGNDVRLTLSQTLREREPYPYGTCTNYSNTEYFSQYHCFGKCYDDRIFEDCGCYEPGTPVEPSEVESEYCMSMKTPAERLTDQVLCRKMSLSSHLNDCLDQCHLPCSEVQGKRDMMASEWPSTLHQLVPFYTNFIQNTSLESKYKNLKTVVSEIYDGTEVDQPLLASTLRSVRENFSRLTIRLTDHRVFLLKDIKKIQLSELGSQLGGALNLWSGITIFVVLEVVELVYRLLRRVSRLDQPAPTDAGTEQQAHCATCRCKGFPAPTQASKMSSA